MSFNLIDSAKQLFTSEMVSKISNYTSESENGIIKALSGVLPLILSGFTDKVSNHEGAGFIARSANEADESGILNNPGSFFDNESGGGLLNKGAGLVHNLFANKTEGITGLLSNFAGVKSTSISSLMSMAAPVLLAVIGKHAKSNNLDTGGITSFLNTQKGNIAAAIPSGLNLQSVLGSFAGINHTVSPTKVAAETNSIENNKNSNKLLNYLLPLVLLAIIAVASYYISSCSHRNKDTGHAPVADNNTQSSKPQNEASTSASNNVLGTVDTLTGDFIYNLGNMVTIDLPNGAGKLNVGEFSTENKLYKFLSDASATLDTVKGNWFEFTNVRFKTGSTEITEESMNQLKNMVAITKAFPAAQFKIGGYTDNTGSEATNIALSQKRADAVAVMLKKLGVISSSFTGTKGYGPAWPIADNNTAEGRAQNRRVAVNVKAK